MDIRLYQDMKTNKLGAKLAVYDSDTFGVLNKIEKEGNAGLKFMLEKFADHIIEMTLEGLISVTKGGE